MMRHHYRLPLPAAAAVGVGLGLAVQLLLSALVVTAASTPGAPAPEAASEQAERVFALQEAERQAAANAPKYVPGKGLVKATSKATENAPTPLNNLTPGSKAHSEWVATYGETHNPDGTPK